VTTLWPLQRGRVYAARLSNLDEDKHFLVVSNNRRNNQLPQVLAVRLTTTPKPDLPSIVRLGPPEAFAGSVICDDIVEIWQDEVTRGLGALTHRAMEAVGWGLMAALDLSP
jgi:mRNA interferase MazF